jgi:Protein of unknown function (DUF4038)
MWSVRGRYLYRDDAPWFLLGDTAWELFRRLTLTEADHYLATRATQGFNTVLAVALSGFGGPRLPNLDGHLPFANQDLSRPEPAYWQHIDAVVELANNHRLAVGLLPTWGANWHDDPVAFDEVSAAAFGRWMAERYGHRDVIWVLGGDRPVSTDRHQRVIEAFAIGIRDVCGESQLLTYHPNGHRSSTEFLPDADWITFDIVQSGHTGWGTPGYQLIEQDLARRTPRPILDAEPNYESHPVMGVDWKPLAGYFFDDADVRRSAYHAVFAGACGHVYGCNEGPIRPGKCDGSIRAVARGMAPPPRPPATARSSSIHIRASTASST